MCVSDIAKRFNVTKSAVFLWLKDGLPYEWEKTTWRRKRRVIDPNDVIKRRGLNV